MRIIGDKWRHCGPDERPKQAIVAFCPLFCKANRAILAPYILKFDFNFVRRLPTSHLAQFCILFPNRVRVYAQAAAIGINQIDVSQVPARWRCG